MVQTAQDMFFNDVPELERVNVLRALQGCLNGVEDPRVVLRNISLYDQNLRRAQGLLRWEGREHVFCVETDPSGKLVFTSWNSDTAFAAYPAPDWTLAPYEMLIQEAINKSRQAFLLEKWDKLLERDDVARLLARFTFDAHKDPVGPRQRLWREKVDRIGFDIVTAAESERLRILLSPYMDAPEISFRSQRSPAAGAGAEMFKSRRTSTLHSNKSDRVS